MRVFTTTPTVPADRAMHEGPQCQEAQTDCLSEIFQRKQVRCSSRETVQRPANLLTNVSVSVPAMWHCNSVTTSCRLAINVDYIDYIAAGKPGRAKYTPKCPFSRGSCPPSNARFFGPAQFHIPNGISFDLPSVIIEKCAKKV